MTFLAGSKTMPGNAIAASFPTPGVCLKAWMFLLWMPSCSSPRRSQVDIVQSVGRVMRRSPGKQYGYIILPIGIPEGKTPEEVLDNDEKYGVVWDVLQALRAHDDRFNAEINKIDLNKGRSSIIDVVDGTGKGTDKRRRSKGSGGEGGDGAEAGGDSGSGTWLFPVGEWREAILARVVKNAVTGGIGIPGPKTSP